MLLEANLIRLRRIAALTDIFQPQRLLIVIHRDFTDTSRAAMQQLQANFGHVPAVNIHPLGRLRVLTNLPVRRTLPTSVHFNRHVERLQAIARLPSGKDIDHADCGGFGKRQFDPRFRVCFPREPAGGITDDAIVDLFYPIARSLATRRYDSGFSQINIRSLHHRTKQ